jgi:hypothetical protein
MLIGRHRSSRNGHLAVVKLLLAKCSALSQRDLACLEYSCLRHAIINSHVAVVDTLLAYFPDTPVSALEARDGQAVKHVIQFRDASMLATLFQHFGRPAVLKVHRQSLANRLLQGPCIHARKLATDSNPTNEEDPETVQESGRLQWLEAPFLPVDESRTNDEIVAVLYPIPGNLRVAKLSFSCT